MIGLLRVYVVAQWVGRRRDGLTRYRDGLFKKRGLDVREARRMVQDRSEWRGFEGGMHGV